MPDIFDEQFIEKLSSDPLEAMRTIIMHARPLIHGENDPIKRFDLAGQAYALAREYAGTFAPEYLGHMKSDLEPGNKGKSSELVLSCFNAVLTQIETQRTANSVQSFESRAKALIQKADAIEFTDGDLNRLQELINEIRQITVQTEVLEERHRSRILARLEKLQGELHKRVTKLDNAWLLLPEIGLALGQFGKNAKPLGNLINETLRIIYRAEARRAQLPTDSEPTFLPNLSAEEETDDGGD